MVCLRRPPYSKGDLPQAVHKKETHYLTNLFINQIFFQL